ncbi:ABC transporter ATP-binding protein [Bacteroidia bacterium]|nr:ABC transporter ATP-binding protein [Bacteroidia bacterium]MDC1395545.1 ABC transporter ATP-binding protein [Bacteroidia bacterium]
MKILNVHNFSVKFKINKHDYFEAVKSINFSINQGEILGLIGESGSGKSVASQSITKLIDDAELNGEVIFSYDNKDLDILSTDTDNLREIRSSEIAYIFQEPMTALNPLIPCGKQILEGAKGGSNEYLNELLIKVELSDIERVSKSYPHELSGGQRQRIMIAMALAKKPKLLIADEPTTALDIAVQTEILTLLKKLSRDEQMGILFITHDLLSLRGFADQIAVMYHGELVEIGYASKILDSPKHPYTKALIESRATHKKRGTVLSEIDQLLHQNDGNLEFQPITIKKLTTEVNSDEVLLQLNGINKSHFKSSLFKKEETKVLHDINFSLNQGDILGLIGESGSGKSTIAKLILDIWQPTSGSLELRDTKIAQVEDLSAEIQLVFQDPYSSLNPKHKIGNAISEVLQSIDKKGLKLKAKNGVKEKVVSLLREVGLTASDFDKYPHEFSGGQRQRICIAKALAKNPKIIVLDEAVSALDVSVQAKVLNLLNDLKRKKGLTYLLISHDMNVVSYFCNKIVVLKEGRVIEAGETELLISTPSSEYTKSLLKHSIN